MDTRFIDVHSVRKISEDLAGRKIVSVPQGLVMNCGTSFLFNDSDPSDQFKSFA